MIVADTGAVIALIDRHERNHRTLKELYERTAHEWVLPWAILPEIDYLLATHVSAKAQDAFLEDLAEGGFSVAWGEDRDAAEAYRLLRAHRATRMGLVDAIVIVTAIRLKARAIATLDLRHFGTIAIPTAPALFPRDLEAF
jgi:predicted nucleic acid-binding protein